MKKYKLVLFVLAFIFGLFNIYANSASAVNCASGDLFNTVTGQSCGTTSTAITCPTGDLFSSTTGQRCTTWQDNANSSDVAQFNNLFKSNFRIGLRGNKDVKALQQFLKDQGYYFGKIDGSYGKISTRAVRDFQDDNNISVAVNTYTPPVIPANPTTYTPPTPPTTSSDSTLMITTVSSLPNAKAGQSYSVTLNTSGIDPSNGYNWSVNNGASAAFPVLGLSFGPSYENSIRITGTPSKIYLSGVEQTTPYAFTFNVTVNSGPQTTTKQFTLTVDPVTATNPTPTISYLNTATGTPAKVGDVVNIFGTNFTSNTDISIDGHAEPYNNLAQFYSSSTISFVVPSSLSIGSHSIEVYTPISSGGALVSNKVNLTITAPVATVLYPTISSINTATGATPRPGDMVDVFGINFTSNTGISIDGSAEPYSNLAQFTSSILIDFVIPSNLSVGSHSIAVYVPISGGGTLVSNAFNINVVSQ